MLSYITPVSPNETLVSAVTGGGAGVVGVVFGDGLGGKKVDCPLAPGGADCRANPNMSKKHKNSILSDKYICAAAEKAGGGGGGSTHPSGPTEV